jgi:hypothetical protein
MAPPYVFAVGHNDGFIVAKQYPVIYGLEDKVDVKTTNYFIIDMAKESYNHQEGVIGPLTKIMLGSLCEILHVGSFKFQTEHADSP